jgi:hypothetical protein
MVYRLQRRLEKVYGPFKKGLPLSDEVAIAVVKCPAAFFVARCERVLKATAGDGQMMGARRIGLSRSARRSGLGHGD